MPAIEELIKETAPEQEVSEEAEEKAVESYEDAYDKWNGRADKELPLVYLSDRQSLEESYSPLKVTDTLLIIIIGLRGAGKTLGLAFLGAMCMICDLPVWSNIPIAFRAMFPNGKIKAFRSEKLDMQTLYSLKGDYRGGAVLISELQYYNDCRTSGSVRNRLLDYDIMQVRKLNLSFYADVKNIGWVDNRTQFETDILISSQDLHYSPWGKENNVGKGEVLHWDVVDVSGFWTGYGCADPMYAAQLIQQHKMSGRPMPMIHEYDLTMAKQIWPIYPTNFIVNIFEAMRGVQVEDKIKLNNPDAEKKEKEKRMLLEGKINLLRNQGIKQIPQDELWEEFEILGDDPKSIRAQKNVSATLTDMKYRKQKIEGVWYYVL